MQKTICLCLKKLSLTSCTLKDKDSQVIEPKTNQSISRERSMEALVRFNHRDVLLSGTDLPEGNSTRRVVEMIFRTSWFKGATMERLKVDRVVQIHNSGDTLATFEEYRDMVKRKSGKNCGRCMADGNEIMRFHGISITCSLPVASGVIKLCSLEACHVCNVLRNRCSAKARGVKGLSKIYTTASSGMTHHSMLLHRENDGSWGAHVKRGVLVCRVIGGHVHKPRLKGREGCLGIEARFDSLETQEDALNYKVEELEDFGSDPRAFLPCFLIVYSVVGRK